MRVRRTGATGLIAALLAGVLVITPPGASLVRAAEYEMVTVATYDVDPSAGEIAVSVEVEFTNTTPDPDGQFSVFDEVKLAVHDQAAEVIATDEDGELSVSVEVEDDVNVATVEMREGVRHEETVAFDLAYALPDTDDPHLRVRPSAVVFPAWSFGTAGAVRVTLPDGYEVRVDGDPLTEEEGAFVSGDVADPSRWLALVTALRPAELASLNETVPLSGGTVDLVVRAFEDDEAWGLRTRDLLVEALPLIEEQVGLPYPLIGQLVVTEAVPADATGFGEDATGGTEILVAYDQPPFTVLHQVTHAWLSTTFAEARWIREGLASLAAARVASQLDVDLPFDPVARAEELAAAAYPLDQWSADAGPDGESYGYAASWAFMEELESDIGPDALRTVLRRVAAAIGPYQSASIEPEPTVEGVSAPTMPLTSRSFLDHLETVSGADLAPRFVARILAEGDVALLEERAAARAAFDELAAAADSWGTPDPVRGAMTSWSFDDARRQIEETREWLTVRDALLADMEEAGLSPSDRLQEAYRAYGGGPEAVSQADAHRAVVDAYRATADEVNAERTFVERVGLIGGSQPQRELALANGRFASGDLRGTAEAITEAQRILAAAETGGIVRLLSVSLVVLLVLAIAVVLFRRRASYTASP